MATRVDDLSRRFRARIGGLALLGLGATLVGVGLLQTTSSHFNASCPKGTELIAKFSYEHGKYHFEKPSGNEGIVTITNGSSKGGTAHSTVAIAAMVVQSSSHSVVRTFSPPQTSLHFSNSGLPSAHNKPADITKVQFCGLTKPPVTTPTEPATTPTEPATTPTEPATTPTTPEVTVPATVPVTDPATSATQPANTTATSQPAASTTSTSVEQESPVVTSTSVLSLGSSESSSLPHTGSRSFVLILLGAVLMALGLTFTVVGRASERRANR